MGHIFNTTFSHVFTSPEERKPYISKVLVRMYPATWHDITEGNNFCAARCVIYIWFSLYNKQTHIAVGIKFLP